MPVKVAFLLALGCLVLPGCGSSATRDAIIEAAAAAAIEVGAAALQAAADDASAHDAAKQAARARASGKTPTGNWRLVRQEDDGANCDDANDEADGSCANQVNAFEAEASEADGNAFSLGKCMVCQ